MKIFEVILEQDAPIRNGRDFIRAFSDDEWNNIIRHFNRRALSSTTDAETRQATIDRIQADVGKDSTISEPNLWNRRAANYGMNSPLMSPSWQDIYNHLKSFADTETTLPPATLPSVPNTTTTLDAAQIRTWVPSNVTVFENENDLRTYLIAFKDFVSDPERNDKRPRQWVEKLLENPSNRFLTAFNSLGRTLMTRLRQNGSVTKEEVDDQLVAWVVNTDTTINRMLQAQRNSQ